MLDNEDEALVVPCEEYRELNADEYKLLVADEELVIFEEEL